MIELVFVIVILGILASVAIPRLAATRTDAQISKGRADVASIRSAIMTERQSRLITGDNKYIKAGATANADPKELDTGGLFGGVLSYPITSKDSSGHWHTRASSDTNSSTVKYKVQNTDVTFTYTRSDGVFTCTKADKYCSELTD